MTKDEAFIYVLNKQGNSYQYATTHGGWSVVSTEGATHT